MDFIFRLDADLSFGPDLVESLLAEFRRDPKLGIASPILAEPRNGEVEGRAGQIDAYARRDQDVFAGVF